MSKCYIMKLCCSHGSAHVLASLSCFMDMESVIEMMENKESNHLIMDRITSGKDLHPEIEKILVVDTDIPIERYFHRGSYMKWNYATIIEAWDLGEAETTQTWTGRLLRFFSKFKLEEKAKNGTNIFLKHL